MGLMTYFEHLHNCMVYRSFNQALTLDYLDSPRVKIYVHDSAKDVFYELGNLEDIRDRSVLKVFEADSSGRGPGGLGPNGLPPVTNADEFLGGVPASQIRGHSRQDTTPPIIAWTSYSNLLIPDFVIHYLCCVYVFLFAGPFQGILFRHWNKMTVAALEI